MNQLTILEKMTPVEIFTAGTIEQVLKAIDEECQSTPQDPTTDKGRKEIASLAYKVARSKTFIDDAGKKVGEEFQVKINAINAERKKARDHLDKLKDSIRKPVDEWEQREKDRVAEHQSQIKRLTENLRFVEANTMGLSVERIDEITKDAETSRGRDWQEFQEMAMQTIDFNIKRLNEIRAAAVKRDEERAELDRLRKEASERQQKERDEAIAREAADKAKREAEAKAKRDAELAEEARLKEIEKAEAAKKAQELAEKRAKEAEARVEAEKKKAIEDERKRAAEAKAKAEADIAKREADKKHRTKIHAEILEAISSPGVSTDIADKIVMDIVNGDVPHLKVIY